MSCNGTGPFDRYILIHSEEDFQKIRDNPAGEYLLTQDIFLHDPFEPIGTKKDPFSGTFDGNNKTISNLKIARSKEVLVGFFGYIASEGNVRNLKIILAPGEEDDPSIEGKRIVGGLAGWNEGSISHVGIAGGTIKGGSIVGGLVGYLTLDGSIKNSYATADVIGTTLSIGGTGGLVGKITIDEMSPRSKNDIENSYATGNVKGDHGVGGLAGVIKRGAIKNSYATGNVTGTSEIGGLVGSMMASSSRGKGIIENSYAIGSVDGDVSKKDRPGGLVGGFIDYSEGTARVQGNYFDATLTSNGQWRHSGVGKYMKKKRAIPIQTIPFYTLSSDDRVYTRETNGALITKTNFVGWDFDEVWYMPRDGTWPLFAWQESQGHAD